MAAGAPDGVTPGAQPPFGRGKAGMGAEDLLPFGTEGEAIDVLGDFLAAPGRLLLAP